LYSEHQPVGVAERVVSHAELQLHDLGDAVRRERSAARRLAICQDERPYANATLQQWTSLDKLRLTNRESRPFSDRSVGGLKLRGAAGERTGTHTKG
jgi:hypothetical protein